ncbi:MAG: EAL domain-containing protein [Gallionella sp.]|nr:EAL domain-containing protein [Gallionella sp.]
MKLLHRLVLCVLLSCLSLSAWASVAGREIHIGVLSFRPIEQTRAQWQPTADFLNASIPDYRFIIEPLYLEELDLAVNSGRFEFVLTNPEHYVTIREDHGLSAIATLMSMAEDRPVSSFGGVIFVRVNRPDIKALGDLRNKVIASPAEHSFGGYLMQRWMLFKNGIDIDQLGKVYFTGMPQDRVVTEVLEGRADAGFVRTGVLESLVREGKLRLDQVRVINPQPASRFPQQLSTELYPEWAFAAPDHLPEGLSKAVMLALLNIRPEDEAARMGKYYGFSPAGNYASVEAVLLRLRVHPGAANEFDWRDVSKKYALPILGGVFLLLLGVLAVTIHLWLVNRRLQRTYEERDHLAAELSKSNATLEHKVEQRTLELKSSEARFHQLFEDHASPMLLVNPASGEIVDANTAAGEFYGYQNGQMCGMNIDRINMLPPEQIAAERDKALSEGQSHFVFPHRIADGSIRVVEVHASPIEIEGRTLLFSIIHDITERHAAENKLRLRDAALNAAANAIIITDVDGVILWANQAFTDLTGYSEGETIGSKPKELLKSGMQDTAYYERLWKTVMSGHVWHGELVNRRKDGSLYDEEMTITPIRDESGRIAYFVSVKQDISVRKEVEAQMHDLAFYDPLTHLPNRRLLLDRLGKALATSSRNNRHGALMFLDLDHFKKLNDVHGHDIGDLLLIEVAHRITGSIREQDSAARLGGDEFVVMLEDLSEHAEEAARQAEVVAEKVRAALAAPYLLTPVLESGSGEAIEHRCTSSIGVTVFHNHEDSLEDLLKWTDMAMYQAKTAGRNVIRFFDPAMQSAVETRALLEEDLRLALELGQFNLYYQVQVSSARKPIGGEVLLRWNHPRRGLVSPMDFIPLAEENGLILPIGLWVLDTACAQIKAWQDRPSLRGLVLAVNVSARQFRQPDFVGQVLEAVRRHAINPLLLKLELTENLVLEDIEGAISKMHALKDSGVRLSLDDFGTGYSSLSYLKRLPIDQLKVDQSFVRDITTDKGDAVMVRTIVDLGMNFEVDVLAEGVETEEQFKLLQRYGCANFQGYLFSRPVPLEQFEALLSRQT